MSSMNIPNRNVDDIFRDNLRKNRYIKLVSKCGAMWNYAEHIGTQEILTRDIANISSNWSLEQINDKKPPITEWFLFSHYSLYDVAEGCIVNEKENKIQRLWLDIKNNILYKAVRRREHDEGEEDDILVPDELVERLYVNESFNKSDDRIPEIDFFDGENRINNTQLTIRGFERITQDLDWNE